MESVEKTDAVLGGYEMSVKLSVFEGPLDLLLFLIRKSEIDIYDIPIAEITGQYMDALKSMKEMSLEIAGEFFVMASTLMYIKSRMLLPMDERSPEGEDLEGEEADPRWQLVEQLIEYKKIKSAAADLEDLINARGEFLDRRVSAEDLELPRPLRKSDRMEIWTAFNLVLRNLAEKFVEGRIREENVTVADRMEYILSLKHSGKVFAFSSLFTVGKTSLTCLVATFLAMLELTRLHKLSLVQDGEFEEIYCEFLPDSSDSTELESGEEGE